MKVVYVAGPYRAKHNYQIWDNVQLAREKAVAVWNQGHVALCPHLNAMFFEGATTAQGFIDGTLELMRRCDAVLVCGNFESSEGTLGEIAEAKRLGIPVFMSLPDLFSWLAPEEKK